MGTIPGRLLLILNPNSRSGHEASIDDGRAALEADGWRVTVEESGTPDQTAHAITTRAGEFDLVVLGGCDGTIHSAAEALLQSRLPLGLLPLGTANDLARSLAIPLELPGAFAVLRAGHRRRIDLGTVNGHYFLNAVHIGLGAAVTRELTPAVKKTWGVLSYGRALTAALSRRRSFRVTIDADGSRRSMRSIHIGIGNGRFYGGGNVIDAESSIDEGLLHLYSIEPQSVWELATLAPLVRLGRQRQSQRTFATSGRVIELRTRPTMEVLTDGEPTTVTPARLEVLPGALEVVAPPRQPPDRATDEEAGTKERRDVPSEA
jgi:YegS/Rv2252/BmrU family lipid kinase